MRNKVETDKKDPQKPQISKIIDTECEAIMFAVTFMQLIHLR